MLEQKTAAIIDAKKKRAKKPINYSEHNRRKKKENTVLVNELNVKSERIENLRKSINYLNNRICNKDPIETISLLEYTSTLNSEESDDEDDNENDGDANIPIFQVDHKFSGNYKFNIDVSKQTKTKQKSARF